MTWFPRWLRRYASIDWLEPEIELNPAALSAEVARWVAPWVPAWRDWDVQVDGSGTPRMESYWDTVHEKPARYALAVRTGNRTLTLSRRVPADNRNLTLTVSVERPPPAQDHKAEIEIFINDQSIQQGEIPLHRAGQPEPPPISVLLEQFEGQDVALEIVVRPEGDGALIRWSDLRLVDPS